MPERKHTPKQPAELRVRGVRLVKENRSNYSSDSAACALIAEKRPGRSSADKARIKELERENKELRTATTKS